MRMRRTHAQGFGSGAPGRDDLSSTLEVARYRHALAAADKAAAKAARLRACQDPEEGGAVAVAPVSPSEAAVATTKTSTARRYRYPPGAPLTLRAPDGGTLTLPPVALPGGGADAPAAARRAARARRGSGSFDAGLAASRPVFPTSYDAAHSEACAVPGDRFGTTNPASGLAAGGGGPHGLSAGQSWRPAPPRSHPLALGPHHAPLSRDFGAGVLAEAARQTQQRQQQRQRVQELQ